mgnify:CR=1 FL=1
MTILCEPPHDTCGGFGCVGMPPILPGDTLLFETARPAKTALETVPARATKQERFNGNF